MCVFVCVCVCVCVFVCVCVCMCVYVFLTRLVPMPQLLSKAGRYCVHILVVAPTQSMLADIS